MKNLIYYEKPHLAEIDEKYHQLNIGNIGNAIYWWKFFEAAALVEGDIVECGIGRGRSLIIISSINRFLSKEEGGQRRILAYDSFDGFPEPSTQDQSLRNPKKGDWSYSPSGKYKYTLEFITEVLSEAGIEADTNELSLYQGFFSESLPHHPDRPIAILHIDGDLYQSYKDTLENLYSKVSTGGIIVFDDFQSEYSGYERWPGSRIAVKEFLGERFFELKLSDRGTYYFVKS